jgi:hypothetical protein
MGRHLRLFESGRVTVAWMCRVIRDPALGYVGSSSPLNQIFDVPMARDHQMESLVDAEAALAAGRHLLRLG